jgi:hypothetical protein
VLSSAEPEAQQAAAAAAARAPAFNSCWVANTAGMHAVYSFSSAMLDLAMFGVSAIEVRNSELAPLFCEGLKEAASDMDDIGASFPRHATHTFVCCRNCSTSWQNYLQPTGKAEFQKAPIHAMFVWLIRHQPAVLFFNDRLATSQRFLSLETNQHWQPRMTQQHLAGQSQAAGRKGNLDRQSTNQKASKSMLHASHLQFQLILTPCYNTVGGHLSPVKAV